GHRGRPQRPVRPGLPSLRPGRRGAAVLRGDRARHLRPARQRPTPRPGRATAGRPCRPGRTGRGAAPQRPGAAAGRRPPGRRSTRRHRGRSFFLWGPVPQPVTSDAAPTRILTSPVEWFARGRSWPRRRVAATGAAAAAVIAVMLAVVLSGGSAPHHPAG